MFRGCTDNMIGRIYIQKRRTTYTYFILICMTTEFRLITFEFGLLARKHEVYQFRKYCNWKLVSPALSLHLYRINYKINK